MTAHPPVGPKDSPARAAPAPAASARTAPARLAAGRLAPVFPGSAPPAPPLSASTLPASTFLALALAALALLAPADALALERAALPASDAYAVLAFVQAMHRGDSSRNGPGVVVFEVGGGDPAMNGSFLYLRIDHEDRSLVWNTGLNVRRVRKMSFAPGNAVLLLVDEDFLDARQAIASRTTTYRVRFRVEGGALGEALSVETAAPGRQ